VLDRKNFGTQPNLIQSMKAKGLKRRAQYMPNKKMLPSEFDCSFVWAYPADMM
jgi:hypothetical protein